MQANVLNALTRSGYPLEMRVAALARRSGANAVEQSRFYEDLASQKIREIDVVATWLASNGPNAHGQVSLVIECKDKPRPWVLFDSDDGLEANPYSLFSLLAEPPKIASRLPILNKNPSLFSVGTLLQPVRISHSIVDPTKKGDSDQDGAWSATQQVVTSLDGYLRDIWVNIDIPESYDALLNEAV